MQEAEWSLPFSFETHKTYSVRFQKCLHLQVKRHTKYDLAKMQNLRPSGQYTILRQVRIIIIIITITTGS